jgi:ABC-type protease/lipase transport system fused ATPase/permease subunit
MENFGQRRATASPPSSQILKFVAFAASYLLSLKSFGSSYFRVGQVLKAGRALLLSNHPHRRAAYAADKSEVATFLASCSRIFWGIAIFSGLSNILMLTSSFFMLQVYDRVLPSRSTPTLLALLFLATMLYLFQGALDLIRGRISVRIGRFMDATLCQRVYDALVRIPLKTRRDGDGLQPIRDLDQVRSFLSSGGPSALLDLPWMPLYLGICF